MPKKTNPTTLQQAIIRYEVSTSNSYPSNFRFILRTDGSGILQDLDYQEELDIVHTIDLEKYAKAGEIKLAPVEATPQPRDGVHSLSKLEREVGYGDEIYEAIQELFTENNDALENPVGDPPDDEDAHVGKGTIEDFTKALAAVSYLATVHDKDGNYAFSANKEEFEWHEGDEDLLDLVETIVDAFEIDGIQYQYTDENDGRVTSHAGSAPYFDIGEYEVNACFPSARERLEAKTWLKEMFRSLGLNTAIIDTTFSVAA
jgi:hypothetical protein